MRVTVQTRETKEDVRFTVSCEMGLPEVDEMLDDLRETADELTQLEAEPIKIGVPAADLLERIRSALQAAR